MKISMGKKGSVSIDGRSFSGNCISIQNGKVIVDGVTQSGELVGDINVTVNGDVDNLSNGSGKVVANNVGNLSTGSGDVECKTVSGNVGTGSGDVNCGDINGNVRTGSGDVYRR